MRGTSPHDASRGSGMTKAVVSRSIGQKDKTTEVVVKAKPTIKMMRARTKVCIGSFMRL